MFKLNDVNFTYASAPADSGVKNLNLTIKSGETIIICGESGCGKTTLVRLLNGLIPNYYEGKLSGQVLLDNLDISKTALYDLAPKVGSVFQNPKSQFFTVNTTSEIVFGAENLGFEKKDIISRLERVTQEFGIQSLLNKSLFELSGGEKQKVACASVSAMVPDTMILDEPSSNLDIRSIQDLKKVIKHWKALSKTIVIAEHRLYYLMDLADRIICMRNGEIICDLPIEVFKQKKDNEIVALGLRSLWPFNYKVPINTMLHTNMMELSNFTYSYTKNTNTVLNVPEAKLPCNEVIGLVGRNGAGKSTFARCLCGLEKHMKGILSMGGKCYPTKQRLNMAYMVLQDVNHQLFTESVLDEILLSIKEKDLNIKTKIAEDILQSLNLLHKKDLHPMSLSGGERQRVAIGSALASEKQMILFDEPTSGLDYKHMLEVSESLKHLKEKGKSIFVISHDAELIYRSCTYLVFIEDGKILWQRPMDKTGAILLNDFFTKGAERK